MIRIHLTKSVLTYNLVFLKPFETLRGQLPFFLYLPGWKGGDSLRLSSEQKKREESLFLTRCQSNPTSNLTFTPYPHQSHLSLLLVEYVLHSHSSTATLHPSTDWGGHHWQSQSQPCHHLISFKTYHHQAPHWITIDHACSGATATELVQSDLSPHCTYTPC